jgi:hypothetical protein
VAVDEGHALAELVHEDLRCERTIHQISHG